MVFAISSLPIRRVVGFVTGLSTSYMLPRRGHFRKRANFLRIYTNFTASTVTQIDFVYDSYSVASARRRSRWYSDNLALAPAMVSTSSATLILLGGDGSEPQTTGAIPRSAPTVAGTEHRLRGAKGIRSSEERNRKLSRTP